MTVGLTVRMNGQRTEGTACDNISLGGMCIVFDQPVAPANSGTIWLTRRYQDALLSFESDFRTQWVRPCENGSQSLIMGILFTDMRPADRDALWGIVKREQQSAAESE